MSRPTWVEQSRVASCRHLGLELRILVEIGFHPDPDGMSARYYAFLPRILTTNGRQNGPGRGVERLLTRKICEIEGQRSMQGYGCSIGARALQALSLLATLCQSAIVNAVRVIAMHSRHSRYDRL
jgi:hypothetical protein